MKKYGITLLVSCLLCGGVQAGDYAHLYQNLPEPQAPQIPVTRVSLPDFGGCADGIGLNTDAFRKAISALEKQGGGHLDVPAGIWLTGPIGLKSRIDLQLDRGAIILFTPEKEAFLKDGKMVPGITASKREDVSITGEGVIDGNGEWWRAVKRGKVSDTEWKDYLRMGGTVAEEGSLWYPFDLTHFPNVAPSYREQERLRTHLVRFTDCKRVLVQGVTLQNSPKFHLVPQRCQQVIIDGVTVRCPWNAQNGDGIDLMNSQDVLVTRCTVDVGDDGICLKGGAGEAGVKAGPCARILICDNTVFHAHGGFVIGSEFSGGMEDILVQRNVFSGTDTGLRFKSGPGRGGRTKNVVVSDIVMSDIRDEAVVFETVYQNASVGEAPDVARTQAFQPAFTGIRMSRITCRDARVAVAVRGTLATVFDNYLEDSTFFYSEQGALLPEEGMIRFSDVTLRTYETVKESQNGN